MKKGGNSINKLLILISILLAVILVAELVYLNLLNTLINSNLQGELATLTTSSSTSSSSSSTYSSSSTSTSPPSPSLLAYYPFEFNALDYYGRYNGTIYGAQEFTSGKLGSALNFNGTNTYVSLGNVLTNDIKYYFTIGVWVKLASGALLKQYNYIFYKQDDRPGIYISGGRVYFCKWYTSANCFASSTTITENRWYYITYTFDGTTHKAYINGRLVGSMLNSAGTRYSPGTTIFFGKDEQPATSNRYFKGTMDELKIWKKALTQSEIITEYAFLNITRRISGNTVTLNILKYKPLLEGEIVMIAEELPSSLTTMTSSSIEPSYRDGTIIVWLLSDTESYLGDFRINTLPNSLTYALSGRSVSGIKGKWALKTANEEGVIN